MKSTLPSPCAVLGLTGVVAGLFACASPPSKDAASPSNAPSESALAVKQPAHPFAKDFEPPRALDTSRIHLEPLGPEHTKLDYAAFMSSIDHLHRTLHWGSWPRPDFTLEDNEKDLVDHRREFDAREAYAFTVQAADRTRCVGCIYLDPVTQDDLPAGTPPEPDAAFLDFWVVENELANDLDRHLLESVLSWLHRDWPFSAIYVSLHVDNERGIAIARALDLAETAVIPMKDHVVFRS